MTPSDSLVTDGLHLSELCARMRKSRAVAIDTEFHSERRFWPELFLVQLADDKGAWAVDPLACPDLSPLAGLVSDPRPVKIIHSSRNDIAILRRFLSTEFVNVFDTQLAAAFLGYGEQTSLYTLLSEACSIKAHKAFCLSDWSRRPLADEQLEYALDDVRLLIPLYAKLCGELSRKKRMDWYSLEAVGLVDPSTYEISMPEIYRRARSAGKLKKNSLPVLWALVIWREAKARELDRPRGSIAPDSLLARLAMMSPRSMDNMDRLRGLPSGWAGKWGNDLLRVHQRFSVRPPGRRARDPCAQARWRSFSPGGHSQDLPQAEGASAQDRAVAPGAPRCARPPCGAAKIRGVEVPRRARAGRMEEGSRRRGAQGASLGQARAGSRPFSFGRAEVPQDMNSFPLAGFGGVPRPFVGTPFLSVDRQVSCGSRRCLRPCAMPLPAGQAREEQT
jgi:ribonuclease D